MYASVQSCIDLNEFLGVGCDCIISYNAYNAYIDTQTDKIFSKPNT